MESLRLFANHSDYTTHKSGLSLPNVAHCIQEDDVHYGPLVETRVIAKINVTNTGESYTIYGWDPSGDQVSKIEIDDGTVITNITNQMEHSFSTTGEHTLYYTLNTNKLVNTFEGCSFTYVKIPGNVKEIAGAFTYCSDLVSVEFEEGFEYINRGCTFGYCTSLTSITFPSSLKYIAYSTFPEDGNTFPAALKSRVLEIYNSTDNKNYVDDDGYEPYDNRYTPFVVYDCMS